MRRVRGLVPHHTLTKSIFATCAAARRSPPSSSSSSSCHITLAMEHLVRWLFSFAIAARFPAFPRASSLPATSCDSLSVNKVDESHFKCTPQSHFKRNARELLQRGARWSSSFS
jgi:hypothetical protein